MHADQFFALSVISEKFAELGPRDERQHLGLRDRNPEQGIVLIVEITLRWILPVGAAWTASAIFRTQSICVNSVFSTAFLTEISECR